MNTTTFAPSAHEVAVADTTAPGAAVLAKARRFGIAVWRGLEAYGCAKAQRELRDLHDRWSVSDPEMAQRLRASSAFLAAESERRDA
jgi:hypothetical protein